MNGKQLTNKRNFVLTALSLLCALACLLGLVSCKKDAASVRFLNASAADAIYGTVYTLPDVKAEKDGKIKSASALLRDGDGNEIPTFDGKFLVASERAYKVSYFVDFSGVRYTSDEYAIRVSLDVLPQITLPLRKEYTAKIGDAFEIPVGQISAYDPYDAAKGNEVKLSYEVEHDGNVFEVVGSSFSVADTGVYDVRVVAENSLGKKSTQSLVVYGDDRYTNCFANFEGEYASYDAAAFSAQSRAAAMTPGVLNTDTRYTHNASLGSYKLSPTGAASYSSFIFAPSLDFSRSDTLTFTFWAYVDKIPSDVNLKYLRVKVYGQNQVKDKSGNDSGKDSDGFADVNIYGLGSLEGKGRQWLPCSFDIEKGQNGPFVVEFFYRGENDGAKIDFDLYLDDFAVAPKGQNVSATYKINLTQEEESALFDSALPRIAGVRLDGSAEYETKFFDLDGNALTLNADGKINVQKDAPVVVKYLKDGIQAIETSTVYATRSDSAAGTQTLLWDSDSMQTYGTCSRETMKIDGIDTSVYRLQKVVGSTKKPSFLFKDDGQLSIYNLTQLKFSVVISDKMWVAIGEDGTAQSCPLAFNGCSSVPGKNLPVVKAYRHGNTSANVIKAYASGVPYLNTSALKGEIIDIVIDFSSASLCSLKGINIWFNNYHNPDHVVADDPANTDSSLYFTDIVSEYDNESPVLSVNEPVSDALLGDEVACPAFTATDNVSDGTNLVSARALYFDGKEVAAEETDDGAQKYVLRYTGSYVWKVVAVDRAGNFTVQEIALNAAYRPWIFTDKTIENIAVERGSAVSDFTAYHVTEQNETLREGVAYKVEDINGTTVAKGKNGESFTLLQCGEYKIVYTLGAAQTAYTFYASDFIHWNENTIGENAIVTAVDAFDGKNAFPPDLTVVEEDGKNALKVGFSAEFFAAANESQSFPGIRFFSGGYKLDQDATVSFYLRVSDGFSSIGGFGGIFITYDGVESTYFADDGEKKGINSYCKVSVSGGLTKDSLAELSGGIRTVNGIRQKGHLFLLSAFNSDREGLRDNCTWLKVTLSFENVAAPTLDGLCIYFCTRNNNQFAYNFDAEKKSYILVSDVEVYVPTKKETWTDWWM